MSYEFTLQSAPGTGLLARKAVALLFIPTPGEGAETLLTSFIEAEDGDEFAELTEIVMAKDFRLPPFASAVATDRIHLRVFGDVELRTDQRSVPMLSGAGSTTWVDHIVYEKPQVAQITVCSDQLDDLTDIGVGTVHAGGFDLRIMATAKAPGAVPTVPTVQAIPITVPVPENDPSRTGMREIKPPPLTAEKGAAAVVVDDNESVATETSDVGEELTLQPGSSLITNSVSGVEGAVRGACAAPVATVRSRLCPAGHPNDPLRMTCDVCSAFLEPGEDGISLVPQPSPGRLVFDDDTTLRLDEDVVMGRNPKRFGDSRGLTPHPLTGDRVSRAHLSVCLRGWDVTVEDCGSRSGSVVVAADGGEPVGLIPGTPRVVEHGAIVYLGSRSFVFERHEPENESGQDSAGRVDAGQAEDD
jgi:hypothetical protein